MAAGDAEVLRLKWRISTNQIQHCTEACEDAVT